MTTQTTKINLADDDRYEFAHKIRDLRVGTLLWDRYEITAVMGSSELGELWRCYDLELGKEVSLRWLPPDMQRSKPVMALLHAGIRRISDKTHPNLAAIRQIVYVGDQIFLVGDFAPGVDVGTWGRAGAEGKRTLEEALPVLQQAAAGLDFAHGKRIIHRNLKPTKLFMGPDGVVRVTDFGLAPHHHMTIINGEAVRSGTTGPYLAPELREGEEEPDSASDQYALAVLAWELLAGTPPGLDAEPPADLPGSARVALRRAMARKPRNRFVSCADFVKALGGERVGGRRRRSAAEWRRIRFYTEVAIALLMVGACLGLGIFAMLAWTELQAVSTPTIIVPPPLEPEPSKPQPAVRAPPQPLIATTPLPFEGKPWVTQTAGMEFVWVPAMGLWVGRFEVANDEYMQKDPEHDSGEYHGLSLNGSRQPVVRVNFEDALAYAAWLTGQERAAGKLEDGWRYRLPSRYEAITYTRAGTAQGYPWGEHWPPTRGNYADSSLATAFSDLQSILGYQDGFPTTAPVEFSGENGWGIFGAGGNVWETTSKEPGFTLFGGWQGGGWDDHQAARTRCDTLYGFIGNARGAVNGFRLLLAPVAGETPQPPDAKIQAPPNVVED
jgi:serine/threonine protein kinase